MIQTLANAQAKSKMPMGEASSRPESSSPTGSSRDVAEKPSGEIHDGQREPINLERRDIMGEPWRGGRRLKMPLFCGENLEGWIFRAELFFEINRLTEAERMMAAGVSFEEEALAWFRWVDARTPFTSWADLKRQLLSRFGSSQAGSLCERFLGIKQVGSMAEYGREYELMSATMTGLPDEVLESTFVKGLKPKIRAKVSVLKPIGLE